MKLDYIFPSIYIFNSDSDDQEERKTSLYQLISP